MNERHIPSCCKSPTVLYPATDALHLVYGPSGTKESSWNFQAERLPDTERRHPALSVHLEETEGITHGKRRLYRGLMDLIEGHAPAAVFVYTMGKAERLGDEVDAVCYRVEKEKGIPIIPVHSKGIRGIKKDGYRATCEALFRLIGTGNTHGISPMSINILGGFHRGEASRRLSGHCRAMGVEVVSVLPGDSPVKNIRRCHGAALNVVLEEGAMLQLAVMMEIEYGIPFIQVSCDGPENTADVRSAVDNYFTAASNIWGLRLKEAEESLSPNKSR